MVTLDTIEQHTIPFDQFELQWRFTEPKYKVLPAIHLGQIQPLDKVASKLLNDLTHSMLNARFQLDPMQFKHIASIQIPESLESEQFVKQWLDQRGLPLEREVYVSWHSDFGAITNWEMMLKYWSDFWYPMSDDLIVVDKTLNWALVIYHNEYIQFGTNRENTNKICENELVGTDNF